VSTKAQEDRATDWSRVRRPDVAMQNALLRFVRGYRAERENGVTQLQVRKHFRATPWDFVNEALLCLIADERIDVRRNGLSRRAGIRYYHVTRARYGEGQPGGAS
jgi:hypothetical protein